MKSISISGRTTKGFCPTMLQYVSRIETYISRFRT
jgi:hypothetical protein